MQKLLAISAMLSCASGLGAVRAADGTPPDWPTLAGSSDRAGEAQSGFVALIEASWVLSADRDGVELAFMAMSGVVVSDGFGFALAEREGACVLVKIELGAGEVVWVSEVPPAFFDSWATPTIDLERRNILLATDLYLLSIDGKSGEELWRIEFDGDAVNATVAVTEDLGPRDRAFVTDFSFGGRHASLYCVNLDPFDAALNPYRPGELIWKSEIGGFGGTTPAYRDGRVYIATSADGGFGPGRIHAFDATSDKAQSPLWTFINPRATDFFGGVSVRERDGRSFVYGASFAFDGQTESANLVKLDADDGSLQWSVASNRTDSIPIVLDDGRIVLSTGLAGSGSKPMIEVFVDLGDRAELAWDSVTATWDDVDGDGVCELGEFLVVGGWNHQPIVSRDGDEQLVYGGAIPTGGGQFGAFTDLYAIDLNNLGGEFLVGHFRGAGGSPTIAGGFLLSVGETGLHAFAVPTFDFDINGDGLVDIDDLYAWEQGRGDRDVDGDGTIDATDRTLLIRELRREEL